MTKRTRKPTHPGAIIREDIMPELGINQTELAHMRKGLYNGIYKTYV